MNDSVLEEAEVVCSTLIGCGCDAMLKSRFNTVIVDEATQATVGVFLRAQATVGVFLRGLMFFLVD